MALMASKSHANSRYFETTGNYEERFYEVEQWLPYFCSIQFDLWICISD